MIAKVTPVCVIKSLIFICCKGEKPYNLIANRFVAKVSFKEESGPGGIKLNSRDTTRKCDTGRNVHLFHSVAAVRGLLERAWGDGEAKG